MNYFRKSVLLLAILLCCYFFSFSQSMLDTSIRKFEEQFLRGSTNFRSNKIIYLIGDVIDMSKNGYDVNGIFKITGIRKKHLTTILEAKINDSYFPILVNDKTFSYRKYERICLSIPGNVSPCRNVVLKVKCYFDKEALLMMILEDIVIQVAN